MINLLKSPSSLVPRKFYQYRIDLLNMPRHQAKSLCHHLLPYIFFIEMWVPLLEQCAKTHCVGTVLVPYTAIKTTVAREEVREGTFYWVDGGTFLPAFGFVLLCTSTEWTCDLVPTPISEIVLFAWRQRLNNGINVLFLYCHCRNICAFDLIISENNMLDKLLICLQNNSVWVDRESISRYLLECFWKSFLVYIIHSSLIKLPLVRI